jgi:pyridoxal phosphate enzyme (YggS family)
MITDNVRDLLAKLPDGVELIAAAKGRTAADVLEAIQAGVRIIGENYLQETEAHVAAIGTRARWHFIGALQQNKVKTAAALCDMVETVDSLELARAIDRHCGYVGKVMPVLIEINSGHEPQKAGVLPEQTEQLLKQLACFNHIRVMGLMTMGPRFGDPEDSRPYFTATRQLFHSLSLLKLPNVTMKYLSMGMTNSYRIAIEEGANIVRIGSKIFEDR